MKNNYDPCLGRAVAVSINVPLNKKKKYISAFIILNSGQPARARAPDLNAFRSGGGKFEIFKRLQQERVPNTCSRVYHACHQQKEEMRGLGFGG